MPRTILIVDDEPTNREILANMLSGEYHSLMAKDGAQALALLDEKRLTLSAVLLDIKMPGMDGYEVLSRIRQSEALSQIPVIVVSALTDIEAEERALSLGAYGFVTKPYRPALVLHNLKNAISLRETATLANALRRDDLTRLYNRRGFVERAEAMIRQHEPGHYLLSCFDIDSFKLVNDQYGMEMGDAVLRCVAEAIDRCATELDGICCRIAADDFAVLYPAAQLNSERIRQCHREAMSPGCISRPIGIRIGRYLVDDLSLSVSAMYDRATLAKESIRGRYDVYAAQYDRGMLDRLLREQRVVGEMEDALAANQFETWFQPQYNHATGALIGAEALVRWRHPHRGIIAPAEFIPIFERNGFIYELDKCVWTQVCRQMRAWLDAGRAPLPVSVNISRYDLFRDDLVSVLTDLIRRYALPAELVRLEITESAFAQSTRQIVAAVRQLVARGFIVEIDDFGSGYSSLNTLKDVPAQILKLDMRFLDGGDISGRGGSIIESVVRMAKRLDMSVIAEGVETMGQANYLRAVGCVCMQGYLFARPMPAGEYEALCDENARKARPAEGDGARPDFFGMDADGAAQLLDELPCGAAIFEFDGAALFIVHVNRRYWKLVNRPRACAALMDAVHPDDRDAIVRELATAIRVNRDAVCDVRLLYGEGGYRLFRAVGRVARRAEGRYRVFASFAPI